MRVEVLRVKIGLCFLPMVLVSYIFAPSNNRSLRLREGNSNENPTNQNNNQVLGPKLQIGELKPLYQSGTSIDVRVNADLSISSKES